MTVPTPTLIVLALVVVLLVVLVWLVARYGPSIVEDQLRTRVIEQVRQSIEDAVGAPTQLEIPSESLLSDGWQRHIPAARIIATEVPIAEGTATLAELAVDLTGIDLTGPRRRHGITAASGRFAARLLADDLNELVTLPPGISRVELRPDRVRLRTVAGLGIDTRVDLTSRGLRVQPTGGVLDLLPATGWTIPLPPLPYGATVTKIEPGQDHLWIHGDVDPAHLVIERP